MSRITKGPSKVDFQVIDFNELQKGDIFRWESGKKVFEVSGRSRSTIEYFPHEDVWGDHRSTKKTTKRKVEINFEY